MSQQPNPATPIRPREVQPIGLDTVAQWVGGALRGRPAKVTGMSMDSRAVQPGDLYAALPGSRAHGIEFAEQAHSAGAVAILTDEAGAERNPTDLPLCVVDRPRSVLGRIAAGLYDDPAAAVTTIGITGTHGKTTTAYLAEAGLNRVAGQVALIGTTGTKLAGDYVKTSLTTPEAPDLHALFARMREEGISACAMEVSSHALVMGRVDGVVFDVAVFLNLGRDHLDFHRDVEDYFSAKAGLFHPSRARKGLVSVDDEYGRALLARAEIPMRTMSSTGADADWRATGVRLRGDGADFVVHTPEGERYDVSVGIPGAFNVSNALAAIAAIGEAGFPVTDAIAGLASIAGVPGRMERIDEGQDFVVVVDYAHKPDAVTAVLTALRQVTSGRIITVLGAGGDRDRGKRTLMGEAASRLSDIFVVTDDNPRSEDPAEIRAAVLAGAHAVPAAERADLSEIGDRTRAIRQALGQARAGDCVLIAGKGHEQGQQIGDEMYPFDDRDVARRVLTGHGGPA